MTTQTQTREELVLAFQQAFHSLDAFDSAQLATHRADLKSRFRFVTQLFVTGTDGQQDTEQNFECFHNMETFAFKTSINFEWDEEWSELLDLEEQGELFLLEV